MTQSNRDLKLLAIKMALTGPRLNKTLAHAGTNKHRAALATGIAYSTLFFWQREAVFPSDEAALKMAAFLGLITPTDERVIRLQEQIKGIRAEIARIQTGR